MNIHTFVMTVTFQIGVDVLGFVKEFYHNVYCAREEVYSKKTNKYHKDSTKQVTQRTWMYKVEQGFTEYTAHTL